MGEILEVYFFQHIANLVWHVTCMLQQTNDSRENLGE